MAANMYSELREEARDHACLRNAYFEQVCLQIHALMKYWLSKFKIMILATHLLIGSIGIPLTFSTPFCVCLTLDIQVETVGMIVVQE